uniref:Protein translocase subunit SecA n=1 Tax=Culex pipiens TaxID=7175 RepID=A0A8D8KC15_CULPI
MVNSLIGNLPYSGRFLEEGVIWRLYGENGLLTSTNKYVAQVTIEPLEDLDCACTFDSAKDILLANLKVTKVLLDEHLQEMQNAKIKSKSCIDVVNANVLSGIQNHKSQLLELSPGVLKNRLEKMNDKNMLFVTRQDLKLFSDLLNTIDNTILKPMLVAMMDRYCISVATINTNQLSSVLPITKNIIYYLSKSLLDVIEEIEPTKSIENILKYNRIEGWKQVEEISWTSTPSTMEKSIEHQFKLLLKLINHFEVGRSTSHHRFPYTFKVFVDVESNANQKDIAMLPDELHVWICLLDDTIAQLFSNDQHVVEMCSALLKPYMNYSLSGQITSDLLESLRVTTHNTIRFVAQAGPFANPQNEQDNELLLKQTGFMNRTSLEGRMSFEDYRDLIEVFAQYWRQRSEASEGFLTKLSGESLKQHVEEIQSLLLKCMAGALDKRVELTELVNFCRVYDELLSYLHNLPVEWFVRMPSEENTEIFIEKGILQLVENKWMDSDKQCYCVKDVEQFEKLFHVLFDKQELPRNFLVESIKTLLKCIVDLETKERWSNDKALTESEQLNATGLCITTVRSSLLYLKEQPDYISFDQFLEESTKPFTNVSNESNSFEDFEKRVLLIKESFWCIRNMNAIDIDAALKLYKNLNKADYKEDRLRSAYEIYIKQFAQFMTIDSNLSTSSRIENIVKDTSQMFEDSITSNWTVKFKHEKLPKILAGLAAVWALHVSKDVAITGQYLKPHCIQILCVFRLLSVDREDPGVRKHLAQVLTGQGKSLVLALVASVLALCGHSVQVMCYSKYLTKRDGNDFEDFYGFFGVRSKITYQTFQQAASERKNRIAGNAEKYIHSCIGLPTGTKFSAVSRSKPILLIDEVDVFFDEKLYGKTWNPVVVLRIPGLDKIQLKIWELAQNKSFNIRQIIDVFLKTTNDIEIIEFRRIMQKSGQYSILMTNDQNQNEVQNYTNLTLFSSLIDDMINTANDVNAMAKNDSFFCKFRLNNSGNITMKTSFGNFVEHHYSGYYNLFMYFRLKQTNFEQGLSNYGYLNLRLGNISYAKIPEEFPLILGVTGTLTTISTYEKKVVKDHYHINEMSVMPSFFGGSNLKFNATQDFRCLNTVNEWMNAIFGRINTIINAKRSVLVVFDTDLTIKAFKRQFAAQLDRLNVLTVDTDLADKERFINDAGVSRTITLSTREMGRGVDYKSSVAVEKNGGMHVIQSFFSVDVKEETQIKGRTARKDNRGSYELIVCFEDLKRQKLVENNESYVLVSYNRLIESRSRKLVIKDAARDEKLREANARHDATVEFYKYK